jgi:hypothetical protein
MKKVIGYACILTIILYSCSVLSESQLTNIHTFATAAKSYSGFPGKAVKKSQELQFNNNVLEASALADPNQIIHSLDIAKAQFEKGKRFSKKMDLSLSLIQKYASLLAQLSSDNYVDELGKNTKELSADLNDAIKLFNDQLSSKIPANVAKGISQIITIIGDRVIKNKQARALQKFIPIGDTLIQLTAINLVSALQEELKPLIDSYRETFQSEFKTIIFGHVDKAGYNMLQFYIKTNSDYENVEALRKQCAHSALKMASSHKELKDNIMRKKDLKELLKETKDFVSDVTELYNTVDKLSDNE